MEKWHVKDEDAQILLAGPDHEYYWEAWDDVLDYAFLEAKNGNIYYLYQDGDLFAVMHE